MSVITEASKRLLDETGRLIAPIRDRICGVSEAYAAQQAILGDAFVANFADLGSVRVQFAS